MHETVLCPAGVRPPSPPLPQYLGAGGGFLSLLVITNTHKAGKAQGDTFLLIYLGRGDKGASEMWAAADPKHTGMLWTGDPWPRVGLLEERSQACPMQ